MANNLKEEYLSVKGMPDLLPIDLAEWYYVEKIIFKLMEQYGYQQIRLPLLEKTALFKRAIGEATDLIEKEMFSFLDEKNRSLSLRPEGTAGCVRACIEHGMLRQVPQKLWYQGPMFRYEAPQKGRNRQFNQIGLECFGVSSWEAEVEQIAICSKLWRELSLDHAIELKINNLGTPESRSVYVKELVVFLKKHYDQLDLDCQRRLVTNPLRILDSKNLVVQSILEDSPKLSNYLDQGSKEHYRLFKEQLSLLGIKYKENNNTVRGLDYYTGIVWEWTSKLLGAQSAVAAGGRYDNLVEQLGGNSIPAVGLAIGIERLILLLKQQSINIPRYVPNGYLICVGVNASKQKLLIAEKIRDLCGNYNLMVDLSGGNFKNQFKRADRSGADLALVVGEEEITNDTITIKHLRISDERFNKSKDLSEDQQNLYSNKQFTVKLKELYKYIK